MAEAHFKPISLPNGIQQNKLDKLIQKFKDQEKEIKHLRSLLKEKKKLIS